MLLVTSIIQTQFKILSSSVSLDAPVTTTTTPAWRQCPKDLCICPNFEEDDGSYEFEWQNFVYGNNIITILHKYVLGLFLTF